jgi:hypothetical protein
MNHRIFPDTKSHNRWEISGDRNATKNYSYVKSGSGMNRYGRVNMQGDAQKMVRHERFFVHMFIESLKRSVCKESFT